MKRLRLRWIPIALVVLIGPSVVHAQKPAEPYRPMSNQEMAAQGLWEPWIKAFTDLTAKQKAEVLRRHIDMCLKAFPVTDEQRAVVKDLSAKYVTEAMYGETDPEKRKAFLAPMQADMMNAQRVLGAELSQMLFANKPPISVLEAVKNDPAFK
jgi:hypothetical protein